MFLVPSVVCSPDIQYMAQNERFEVVLCFPIQWSVNTHYANLKSQDSFSLT